MRKKIISKLLLFACLLSLGACQSFYFDEKKEIRVGNWAYGDFLEFSFNIEDTTIVYNIYLEVKHSSEYMGQNVYALVHVMFPDAKERKQQVSFELADGKGEWLGKCSGKTCTRRIPFMPNAVFDQKGAYRLKFEQFTRLEKVVGIESLRLIIEKTELKKGESPEKNNQNNQKKVS